MAHRRTQDELKRDRARIAELYVKGHLQTEIAEMLNNERDEAGNLVRDYTLSQPQISNDLKRVREDWQQNARMNFAKARAEELARIDVLEREYWDAWQASMEPREEQEVEGQPQDGNAGGDGAPAQGGMRPTKVKRKTKEPNAGDAKFLRGVQWCIEKRCELLGLDAPEWTAHLDIDYTELTDEQVDAIAEGEDPRHVLEGQENGRPRP